MENLIIFGASALAKLLKFYFDRDSNYSVKGFTVDEEYKVADEFLGLPVVSYNNIDETWSKDEYSMFVAIGPQNQNRLRQSKVEMCLDSGYNIASYVSPNAICHSNLGYNCFVGDCAIINPFAEIGDNNFFWEYSQVSDEVSIGNHCYFSPKVNISTYATVRSNVVIGSGAIVKTSVEIESGTFVGAGCYISQNTERNSVYARRCSESLGNISDKLRINE